jgi:hypothetical protein
VNRRGAEPALGPAKGLPHPSSVSASLRLRGESSSGAALSSAGHGVHRPESPGVTTPAGLR